MNNVWIVVPVISNDVDLTSFVEKLSGGYTAPETYEKKAFNQETNEIETQTVAHPYAGQAGPDLSGRIVFVNTVSGYSAYDGVTNLEDFGDINIYRYWNTGIEYAIDNGADSVIVLNGVIDIDPFLVKDSHDEFISSGKEVVNISDGAAILISALSSIRADEQFQIWFGDNDIYLRAEVLSTKVNVPYSGFDYLVDPFAIDMFDTIVVSDEEKYNIKWS